MSKSFEKKSHNVNIIFNFIFSEPFSWIDERHDGLYNSSFDWSPNDIKAFNTSSTSTAPTLEQKSSYIGVTNTVVNNTPAAVPVIENLAVTLRHSPIGDKIYHQNSHHLHNLATVTATTISVTSPTSLVATGAAATPDLLREFEDVLISTTTGSLTPPESPRDQANSLITLLQVKFCSFCALLMMRGYLLVTPCSYEGQS